MGDVLECCCKCCCVLYGWILMDAICEERNTKKKDANKTSINTPYNQISMDSPSYSPMDGPKVFNKESDTSSTSTMKPLVTHTVQPGDTIQGIMLKYSVSVRLFFFSFLHVLRLKCLSPVCVF